MSKDTKEPDHHHTGSVVAQDDDFTEWLNRFWHRSEPPQRIELWQSHGRRMDRGNLLHSVDFGPNDKKLDPEKINKIANELWAAAQNDCNVLQKRCTYEVSVIDNNRKATPLTRRLGPFLPTRPDGRAVDLDDPENADEDDMNAKALAYRYWKEGADQVQRDKNRNDQVVSGMFVMQHRIIENQQAQIDRLMSQNFAQFQAIQDAQDRQLDRDLVRQKEKFRQGLWEEAARTARNLLPGLFAQQQQQPQLAQGPVTATQVFGPTPERTLVENFLFDVEKNEELNIKLFGDYTEVEGKVVQSKEGVFSVKQYGILIGVREGKIPVEALDDLMPNSGTPLSVTQEQLQKAIEAGVPQSMGIALMEVFALRNRAREARAAALSASQQTSTNEVQK